MTKKYVWVLLTLFVLTILFTGCGLTGAEPEVVKVRLNRTDWPTPVSSVEVASPTPFPKITLNLPPTPTRRSPEATATPVPAAASASAATGSDAGATPD